MGIIRFLKDWTLPTAMVTGVAAYLLFHYTPALQPIGRWYAPFNNGVMPVLMFFILFVTFCKIDFKRLTLKRWHLWISFQQIVLVFILMGIIIGFELSGKLLILLEAVLVCIISPCAAASAVVTAKIGGSPEEMTTYTFISNFLSTLLIPISFTLLPRTGGGITTLRLLPMFINVFWQVSIVLLLPMGFAYIVKHHFKRLHRRIVRIKDMSYYMWAVLLVVVTGTTVMNIFEARDHTTAWFLMLIATLSLAVCIIQFATGRHLGDHNGRSVEGGQSLGQKNTAFAIWVAVAYLHPLSSVGPGCYILWQNIINAMEIRAYQKKHDHSTQPTNLL